jgi:Uma2 family endonuclease
MAAAPTSDLITPEQFLTMRKQEGAELVDGRIVEVPMGSMSSWLGGYLHHLLMNFVLEANLGWVFPQETGVAVWPGRRHVRKPDLTFIRKGRLQRGQPDEGWLTTVPDLVVEVVSPRDRAEDLELKLQDYREAGIPLIWLIYPSTQRAQVLGANRPRTELAPDGVLDGEDILPGFKCSLADLFAAAAPEK